MTGVQTWLFRSRHEEVAAGQGSARQGVTGAQDGAHRHGGAHHGIQQGVSEPPQDRGGGEDPGVTFEGNILGPQPHVPLVDLIGIGDGGDDHEIQWVIVRYRA